MRQALFLLPAALLILTETVIADSAAESSPVPVGAAIVDITPDGPVRLAGYASRTQESDGVTARIHARALAIGGELEVPGVLQQPLSVLVTVDNCGVTADIVEAVFATLSEQLPLQRSHFALSSTHTHSAPWLKSLAPLSQLNISPEQHARLDRYEADLKRQLVQVVLSAVESRRPARLTIGCGHADFARNRRLLKDGRYAGSGVWEEGPVDHRLLLLAAHDTENRLIAVLTNYACHSTTNAGADNRVSGDWPGYAADAIEQDFAGAVALVAVGCGADVNPLRSRKTDYSAAHGRRYADSVQRVLNGSPQDHETPLRPLDAQLTCQLTRISLPYGPLPSREDWEAQVDAPGIDGELAERMLQRLERGETIPAELTDYPVQTWTFGQDLAMVFLGGEVVQDYRIRMSDMFDADRLWINAYCNDVPCYIPSRRILREGGYEADRSQKYFGRPGRLSPESEDRICWAVQKQLPHSYYSDRLLEDYPGPQSPEEALTTMSVRPGLKVELVAAEPLIEDPVAFDWDSSGRLWVVEMGNYPNADDGGRVRVLEDEDGDGRYDSATTFLDNLPWPSGICVWRDGAIVTAAPDVLYAVDRNGDGRADETTVLCTGFGEGNQQHRVNGLRWGMDGWMYLANGDSGGSIRPVGRTTSAAGSPAAIDDAEEVSVRYRDVRLRPDDGIAEAISGQTQFCRERTDFGQWFGNNNSNPIWHYVIDDRYVKRNPFAKIGRPLAQVSFAPGAAPVFPTSKTVARFNDFHAANRFTSACGTAFYRDHLLGEEFYGNAFTCEPVHNLVSRLVVRPQGAVFHGVRADDETDSEYLSSADNWCRPTMVRTGPDGAHYVCDMYRQVIEHPEWIPVEAQRRLNLRAGSSMGRIYRILPTDALPADPQRAWLPQSWDQTPLAEIVDRLAGPGSWWRDTAQRILQHRQTEWTADLNSRLPWNHELPAVRVQAVCTAAMLKQLSPEQLVRSLHDPDPQVRRRLIVLLEEQSLSDAQLNSVLSSLVEDEDAGVRMQLACTLGSLPGDASARALGRLLTKGASDEWIRKSVLTSLNADNVVSVFRSITEAGRADGPLVSQLIQQCQQLGRSADIHEAVVRLIHQATEQDGSAADLAVAADVAGFIADTEELSAQPSVAEAVSRLATHAQRLVISNDTADELLIVALHCLAVSAHPNADVTTRLEELIRPAQPSGVQQAALDVLLRQQAFRRVLDVWRSLSPERRSQALASLLSREDAIQLLLQEIESEDFLPADLGAVDRDRLLNHASETIRNRATQVLGGSTSIGKQELVAQWTSQLTRLHGDAAQGKTVFTKRCATCHRLQETGSQIGADLSALRDRSTGAMVTAVLNPNRAVETKYLSYTAVLNDGRSLSGMLKNESTNSVTLIGTDGKPQELLRSDLDELLATGRSFMPEGLERDLSPQDLADVIAFVQTAGSPWKQFSGNTPQVISAGEDGTLLLPASAAELYGPNIEFDDASGMIRHWTSSADTAVWQLNMKGWGDWKVECQYSCTDASAGNLLKVASPARMMSARVPGTGDDPAVRWWNAGTVELSRGTIPLTLSAPEELQSPLFQLKAVRLTRID